MSDNSILVPANQIVEAENSYASLNLNKHIIKQNSDIATLKEQLESEVKARTELYMHYQEEEIQILSREKELAVKEADFYRRQSEEASKPKLATSSDSSSSVSVPKIPKIPEFSGSSVGFPRWVSWVDDLFSNYPQLNDFSQRMMVVDSLKGDARSWYDAEPDSSTVSWPALKDALLRKYGGTNSISNALTTISLMKLTSRSDF
ncbi:hypothetical protein AYI69_g4752, partial [Smittium culicis]